MPILEVIEELSRNGRMKRTLRCLCDACERVECFKPWKNRYKLYHFCSRSCSNTAQRPNGLLYKQVVETNLRLFMTLSKDVCSQISRNMVFRQHFRSTL